MGEQAVGRSEDLERILALPRRTAFDRDRLVDEWTALLKTPDGTQRLRPVQALALSEIALYGGALLPIGVGEGKTLILALAAFVLGSKWPILLLPASLRKSATDAHEALAKHWLVPRNLRILSYEMLGRLQSENELDDYADGQLDALLNDEVHFLKNLDASCTKRVARKMAKDPMLPFVGASGTIMRDNLHDFAHLARWALKLDAPIPHDDSVLNEWADALGDNKAGRFGFESGMLPGALLDFATKEDRDGATSLTAARRGFRRRLVETPGVVAAAGEGEDVGASILVRALEYKVAPITEAHFDTLRNKEERPDGVRLEQGVDKWRHARELALGFHYAWDPPAPDTWLKPRKAWSAYVRRRLEYRPTVQAIVECEACEDGADYFARCTFCNGKGVVSETRHLDSPFAVVNALDKGWIDDEGVELLAAWRKVRDTFTPNTVPRWHDDSVLKLAAEWGKGGGIIWTEHHFFAERLAEETDFPYFGAGGLDAGKRHIESCNAKTIIASIDANKDGKNLQGDPERKFKGWSRNLVVSLPDGWDALQQLIARTHRPGQLADSVLVEWLLGCAEHINAWRSVMLGTIQARDTIGAKPKLLLADLDVDLDKTRSGWRWRKGAPKPVDIFDTADPDHSFLTA